MVHKGSDFERCTILSQDSSVFDAESKMHTRTKEACKEEKCSLFVCDPRRNCTLGSFVSQTHASPLHPFLEVICDKLDTVSIDPDATLALDPPAAALGVKAARTLRIAAELREMNAQRPAQALIIDSIQVGPLC